MARTKQVARKAPAMTPAMRRKEEKLEQAYERERARELAKAARILKDGPTAARATRSKAGGCDGDEGK